MEKKTWIRFRNLIWAYQIGDINREDFISAWADAQKEAENDN